MCWKSIDFNTKELYTECGGNYSNASGALSSPSHPNQYPELADCVYLISQPNRTYVNISFITMDIVCQEMYSQSDYIEMRDGKTEESPIMGQFCGNGKKIPSVIISTQNNLWIRWGNKLEYMIDNSPFILSQIQIKLPWEWDRIPAQIWIIRSDWLELWQWRKFHNPMWHANITIISTELSRKCGLCLHNFTDQWHNHHLDFSQNGNI